ncbi:MAG: Spo0B domain-containing protein [Oscillospiraceae bacterium]|nr:Spo0B domain-containing protein [Oscillospiraceae bacterium]
MEKQPRRDTLKSIHKRLLRTQLILILTLAVFLGGSGIAINFCFENQKRYQNLQNVAETIARSPLLIDGGPQALMGYLDSLKDSLGDIDVISIVGVDGVRLYHSNHALIGSAYDGTLPEFQPGIREYYSANDTGPSGTQRRAYAAIYDQEGNYRGFVIAVMLMENIREQTLQTVFIFLLITLCAVFMELMIASELSGKIRESLLGYEPDVFTAMYQIRDNILESLNEGVLAVDREGKVQFSNHAALSMLGGAAVGGTLADPWLKGILKEEDREFNIHGQIHGAEVLVDRVPIKEDGQIIGAIGILHDRTEYTRLMEDLTGTRYLVDSMRANNHDFTNKLHVILGLIQMEMYEEATAYIENISILQRRTISSIMGAVGEPAVAALLIGKTARAAELDIKFVLREGCGYSGSDLHLSPETLVTVIGNLIENAFEAMDSKAPYDGTKELRFGIFSRPGAVLITVEDTGVGIPSADMDRIFENGYSTKGQGRGTGLHQVKALVEALGGCITVESQQGTGTSVSVRFSKEA